MSFIVGHLRKVTLYWRYGTIINNSGSAVRDNLLVLHLVNKKM